MTKYLCLQRSVAGEAQPNTPPSPQQMQEMYAAFQAWQNQFASQLVDLGGRLGQSKLVGDSAALDGPFVEIKELVGGYMIVQARSLDEAGEIARLCPGLVGPNSGVEIVEIQSP